MRAVIFGGARGIGRTAALEWLAHGHEVTLLLRRPETVITDPDFIPYIVSGQLAHVKGDANEPTDVAKLFSGLQVDVVLFSIGAVYPNGRQFSWSRGFILPSPDVCTRALLVLLDVLAELPTPPSRVIAISVMGLGASRSYMPYIHQAVLPWLLQGTVDDKRGVEAALARASASPSLLVTGNATPAPLPSSEVLTAEQLQRVPADFLPEITIVRPAQLKDVPARGAIRAGEDITTWSVGRVDVGLWVARKAISAEWANRAVVVGY